MGSSKIGSNFHRRSGDDERRGIFSKLPPLSIPNALRRLTSGSTNQERKDSVSVTSSTSSAIVGIGSVLAQIGSKKSTTSINQKTSVATTNTPSSALPLSAFSPASSSRSSADTDITTPGSGTPGTINFAIRPGVLPDASPNKTYFPVVQMMPEGRAKLVTWEERRYSTTRKQQGSEASSVLMQRSSQASNGRILPGVYDTTLNRVDVGDQLVGECTSIQDLRQVYISGLSPQDPSPSDAGKDTAPQVHIDWDPSNPGHDTWNESGRDDKWQQRSQLFSNLSAFSLRNAQKRKSPPPKQDVGPLSQAADPTNDPMTPKDVGGLVENSDYFKAAETPLLRPKAISPVTPPPTATLPIHEEEDESPEEQLELTTPKVIVSIPNEDAPRITVALPCSEYASIAEDDQKEDRHQSLFDLSDADSISSSEDEDDQIANLASEERTRTPRPSRDDTALSRIPTSKDSFPTLRRTSSTSALQPIRSRGESIGLADCSRDPMVLAAGFEKELKARKKKAQRECYVYQSRGSVGREIWSVCPGREALGAELREKRRKGRDRGVTF